MKNIYKTISILSFFLITNETVTAQCGVQQTGGTALNMFTLIRNNTSSIASNKDLNTITFIHRNDVALFGGNSGNLKYDISTDGGTTWTLNQATLNPLSTNFARYPNIAIYNPVANTNTANAYVSYMAPTINTLTSGWNGEVTGVAQLGSLTSTETYSQNGIGTSWQAGSLVNGAPGVLWAIDPVVPAALTGFNIYKGVWNSLTSDIVWNINYVCTPPFNTLFSSPVITDYNIAFDPTGQIGYFSFLGHVTPGPSEYGLYPVLYKTTNGGTTWTGPIQVDLTKFSCITSNTTLPNVPSTNIEHDLVVDVNGNPHVITTVGGASNYNFSYISWHHMYDITLKSGLWVAYDLGNVQGSPFTMGVSPNVATQWQTPQASRTADGTKVFFTWTDNSTYLLGAVNSSPQLYGKAFNVINSTWTQTKDFSSCNGIVAGKVFFPHISPEVLEPSPGVFKIPTVYGEPSVANDPNVVANFKFLNNITFSTADFSITVPPANITIQQSPLAIICPGSSITLNANAGQAIWNTGATTTSLSIGSGTATSYSVIAQSGCSIGTATIAVTNLTLSAAPPTASICPGGTLNFSVTGNALGYTWTPGGVTGTNVALSPATNIVTLSAMGSSSCVSTQTLNANILAPPTLTLSGNTTICYGSMFTQTVSGAQTYLWSNATTNPNFTASPTTNTFYTVIGTAANSCTTMQTVNVTVDPVPTLLASSNPTAVCDGQSAILTALGASSYSWNSVPSNNTIQVTPNITTIYTVSGAALNLCESSQTVALIVHPNPTITIASTPTAICIGQTATLTASGAFSYSWHAVTSAATTTVAPVAATVYTVTGASTLSCKATETINLIVNGPPTVSITPSRTGLLCKGEKLVLTASGASTYSWVTPSAANASVEVTLQNSLSYFVTGTNAEGCTHTKSYSVNVSSCTGIDGGSRETKLLKIYPNPSKGELTISAEKDLDLKIINSLGQTVKLFSLSNDNHHSLSVNDLDEGVYFVVTLNGTEQITHKIVIAR